MAETGSGNSGWTVALGHVWRPHSPLPGSSLGTCGPGATSYLHRIGTLRFGVRRPGLEIPHDCTTIFFGVPNKHWTTVSGRAHSVPDDAAHDGNHSASELTFKTVSFSTVTCTYKCVSTRLGGISLNTAQSFVRPRGCARRLCGRRVLAYVTGGAAKRAPTIRVSIDKYLLEALGWLEFSRARSR
jgi:hypothetical protein